MLAFVLGDYLAELANLGAYGSPLAGHARHRGAGRGQPRRPARRHGRPGGAHGRGLRGPHRRGPRGRGDRAAGHGPGRSPAGSGNPSAPGLGTALVFVFLAYGGWSDAATLSAEMRDPRRGITRALVAGMALVTVAVPVRELGVPARTGARRRGGQQRAGGGSPASRLRPRRAGRHGRRGCGDRHHLDERHPHRRCAHDLRRRARHRRPRRPRRSGTSIAERQPGRSSP